MAAAVHIPMDQLSAETRALLERANAAGDILVDGKDVDYRISRIGGRTASEALERIKNAAGADVEVDSEWSQDLKNIIASRYTEPHRDPWA